MSEKSAWDYEVCVHAVIVRGRENRERGTGAVVGRTYFCVEGADYTEPTFMGDSMAVITAGDVAERLYEVWERLEGRWFSGVEKLLERENGATFPPAPFSSALRDYARGADTDLAHMAATPGSPETDFDALACLAFGRHFGCEHLPPRSSPLSARWEEVQKSAVFYADFRRAERRAARILRRRWQHVLAIANALRDSTFGFLTEGEVRKLTGGLG
jgi:hypothetical protein